MPDWMFGPVDIHSHASTPGVRFPVWFRSWSIRIRSLVPGLWVLRFRYLASVHPGVLIPDFMSAHLIPIPIPPPLGFDTRFGSFSVDSVSLHPGVSNSS
jgi:hypothetical protein